MSFTVNQKECRDPYLTIRAVTFDSSYATGGESLTAANLGWSQVGAVWAQSKGGLCFEYDEVNSKLKAYLGTTDTSGTFTFAPGAGDIKGATAITGTMGTADQAAENTNAALVCDYATFTDINTAVGVLTVIASPDVARNLVVAVKNDQGGATTGDLYEGTMSVAVVGTFRGAAQTETISIVSTALNKTIADTKFRAWAGAKPFDTVTSVTVDHTDGPTGALKLAVGIGCLIGYPINSDTGADADFKKGTLSAADFTAATKVDHTNKTINLGTISDGADFQIAYLIDAEAVSGTAYGTSYALPEVPAATDLSGLGEVLVFATGDTKL